MAGEDRRYSAWIRRQPCCMPKCLGDCGPVEQHHPRGPAYGVGMGQRSHDWYSIPLGRDCHHVKLGKMPKEARRKFEFDEGLRHREQFMAEQKGVF